RLTTSSSALASQISAGWRERRICVRRFTTILIRPRRATRITVVSCSRNAWMRGCARRAGYVEPTSREVTFTNANRRRHACSGGGAGCGAALELELANPDVNVASGAVILGLCQGVTVLHFEDVVD